MIVKGPLFQPFAIQLYQPTVVFESRNSLSPHRQIMIDKIRKIQQLNAKRAATLCSPPQTANRWKSKGLDT